VPAKFVSDPLDVRALPPLATGEGLSRQPRAETIRQADLYRQVDDLRRRAQDVLGHKLAAHPALAALADLGRSVFEKIDAVGTLLAREEPCTRAISPLLQTCHSLIDTVAGQVALCEATARDCSAALELARRIVAQERVSFHDLLPLFGGMFDDVRDVQELVRLVPVCGLDLAAFVESQAGEAALFVEGLTAGRVLLWILRDDPRQVERLPEFALAALFEDVGRLPALARTAAARKFHARRAEWLERQHPAIGAALLGAVRRAPADLARMVGQHHERLDGRGYPRGLGARDGLPSGRWLALCTRFAELCLKARPAEGAASREYIPGRIARSVVAESEWGMWSADFAQRLAGQVAATQPADPDHVPALPAAIPEEPHRDGIEPGSPSDRNLHLHDAESGMQRPHGQAEERVGEARAAHGAAFSPVELDWLREAKGVMHG